MTAHRVRVVAAFAAAWAIGAAVLYPALDWYIGHTIRGWFG